MYDSKNVVYEDKDYWVLWTPDNYELYRKGVTCSTRIGKVSLSLGLDQAIKNIEILHRKK